MKLKIRTKILIIVVATFLLATGLNTFVTSRVFRTEYSAALQSKMDVVANTLMSQIERLSRLGITIDNIEGFETQCLEVLRKHKDVAYVMVTRINGHILFHNDPSLNNTMITNPDILKALKRNQQEAYSSGADGKKYCNTIIQFSNGSSGSSIVVIVGYPTALIESKIQELRQYSFIAAMVSLSVATFLLLITLSISVTKPLSTLIGTIEEIRTSTDLSKRVKLTSKDELGYLADSFNKMADYLQKTTTSIDNLNQEVAVRKRAEQRQTQLLEELEKVNQELKDFAYVVSHDLKAPLRGIKTLADWITTDYVDKLDDDGKEQMHLLTSRVDRMHNLIDGVLQYSRVGRVEEEKVMVNLNERIPEVIDLIAPPEDITVTIENELPTIECEQTRIMQVFQNLLSNAVKYIDKPQGQINIGCIEENGFWKFSVADNGPGIEERHFEKIFQMFQTLSPRDEFESTGVGLTLVKKIVEMYGGRIYIVSEIGKGSTFYFTLPKQEVGLINAQRQANTIS